MVIQCILISIFMIYDNPLPSEGVIVEVTYDGGATFVKLDTIIVV